MHTLHISRPAAHTRTRAAQMPEPLPPLAPPSILSDLYLFPAIPTTFRLRRVSCGRHVSATPRPASRGSHEGKRCSVCIITPPPPMCGNVREHAAVVYGHDSGAPDSAGPLNGPHLFIQSRGLISRPVPDKRFENRNPIPIICPPIVCINGPPLVTCSAVMLHLSGRNTPPLNANRAMQMKAGAPSWRWERAAVYREDEVPACC